MLHKRMTISYTEYHLQYQINILGGNMKRRTIWLFIASVCIVTFTIISGIKVWARQVECQIKSPAKQEAAVIINDEAVRKKAEALGIQTAGKNTLLLEKEIHETEVKTEAKQLGIETGGKGLAELFEAIYETKLKNEAEELGISTEGKAASDLIQEVYDVKVRKEAGLVTEGKDVRYIINKYDPFVH